MAKTINTNQLHPNTLFMIRGRLKFSRLAKKIDGDELKKDIERSRRAGQRYIITKPYTKATICDAQVLSQNPQAPTIEEAYAQECLYKSQSQDYSGWTFTAHNISPTQLPWIGQRNPDGSVSQIRPTAELAADQPVTVFMRVYATNQNNGISLDGIIVEAPVVKYYTQNNIAAGLAEKGIIFKPLPDQPVNEEPATDVRQNGYDAPTAVAPPDNKQDAYSNKPATAANYGQETYGEPFNDTEPFGNASYGADPASQETAPFIPNGYQDNQVQGIKYNPENKGY